MIDRSYRAAYDSILRPMLEEGPPGLYDEAALPSYTHRNPLMSWFFWKRIETALSMAGEVEGRSVLDFGCGGGVTFKYLSERGCEISGCEKEFFETTLSVCASLGIEARIYKDLDEIPPVTFDRILALDVFEHIADAGGTIEKIRSLCHGETLMIVSGPTESLPYRAGRKLAGFSGDYHMTNIYDIERLLAEKGLQRRELRKLYFPITLFRVSAWRL